MIKAVATALVLIVGAAVILWYGNTLNSWVVGGLIGGFGALLLSIPISLILFSHFLQHYHKSQQEDDLEDEMVLVQRGSYSIVQDQSDYNDNEEYFDQDQEFYYECDEEIYDSEDPDDEYIFAEQSEWEEKLSHHVPPSRYLPSPSLTRLSATNQDLSSREQRSYYGADPERQSLQKGRSGSRPVTDAKSHRYQTAPSYSHYRSEALRAARMEAALRAEYDEESGFSSARTTRRLEQIQRSGQTFSVPDKSDKLSFSQDLTQSSTNGYTGRPRRVVDALPPQDRSHRSALVPDDTYDQEFPHDKMPQYVEKPIVRRSSRYLKPPSSNETR